MVTILASRYSDYDVESPKSLEPISSKSEDNNSVGTHQSDTESDSDFRHETRRVDSHRKLVFVVLLVAVFGLAFGLGFGLTAREDAIVTTANEAKIMGSEEVVTYEPDTTVQEPVEEKPEPETTEEVKQQTEEVQEQTDEQPPAFGGVGLGMGTANELSWPELVGLPADEAKKILEDNEPGYFVVIVPPSGITTKDIRWDRIFLYTNEEGYVAQVPYPGR